MLDKINYQIFTLFNIGKLPISGTLGSLFTVLFYLLISGFVNTPSLILIIILAALYSLFFLKQTLKKFKNNDPKEIVIDEFVGQLIPLTICGQNYFLIFLSFLSFRFFDITKIYPAIIFDKRVKGPLGILGDDIIAGLYSFITVYILKLNL